MEYLTDLPHLEMLGLARTRITDDGLARISSLSSLHYLSLNETNIGDASVPHLSKLTNLTELELFGTQFTKYGFAKLQAALPQCRIVH